jgi:hypothetical protein
VARQVADRSDLRYPGDHQIMYLLSHPDMLPAHRSTGDEDGKGAALFAYDLFARP